jgi:hypothetical protein
VFVEVKVGVKV